MNSLRRAFVWLGLLQLRILKKPAFWLLLALPPLLALALSAAAGQDKGVVTAAVYPGSDGFSAELAEQLEQESGLVRCLICASPEAAETMVTSGRADAAWIFPEKAGAVLDAYAAGGRGETVRVLQREESVLLRMAREWLFAELFPALSERSFRAALERESGGALSAEDAAGYGPAQRELIAISYGGGDGTAGETDYLLSPVRGLLAVLVTLGGLGAGLLLLEDRSAGRLNWASRSGRAAIAAAELILPMADLSLSAFLALCLAGLNTGPGYELLLLLLLTLAGSGLALLLCAAFRSPWRLAAFLPVFALALLAFCPVVVDLRWARPLSLLLPPYHYLLALRRPVHALWLAVSAPVFWCAGALCFRRA